MPAPGLVRRPRRSTVEGAGNEKPPVSLEETGGKMEREKGFELRHWGLTNYATVHAFLSISPSPQRFPFKSRFPILPHLTPS
jgi:hypothetical protein